MDKRLIKDGILILLGCMVIGFLARSLITPKTPEPLGRLHDPEPIMHLDTLSGLSVYSCTNRSPQEIFFRSTTDGLTNSMDGHDYWVMEVWVHKRDCNGRH